MVNQDFPWPTRSFIRRIFANFLLIKGIKEGEVFTDENVRCIRPGYGLLPRYLKEVLGRQATRDIKQGTPLSWELIS